MKNGFVKVAVLTQICVLHALSVQAAEKEKDSFYQVGPANIDCVIQAAIKQRVPANVLLALASVESGKNGQFVRNKNGTDDVGHFQLNTTHFNNKGVFHNVNKEDAAWRGCYNAELAAWFLRQRLDASTGGDYWTRVANYHSATPQYNAIYRQKLIPLAAQWGKWLQENYPTSVSFN